MGSFQCRLATDPAPPGGSVTAPPKAGDFSLGWTFDFGEAPLDRVIRFSNPLSLRKGGLMAPWKDTTVFAVEADRGAGFQHELNDPLASAVVSLGANAMFDAAKGGGPGHEAILNFELSLGSLLTAKGSPDPICDTSMSHPMHAGWKTLYQSAKPSRISGIPPGIRKDHIAVPYVQEWYAQIYGAMGKVDNATLQTPSISAPGGVLAEVKAQMAVKPGSWKLLLFFWQFDGDTLVGDCQGFLSATF